MVQQNVQVVHEDPIQLKIRLLYVLHALQDTFVKHQRLVLNSVQLVVILHRVNQLVTNVQVRHVVLLLVFSIAQLV